MNQDRAQLGRLLREARTIAVVGLSPNPGRPSHEVAAYLRDAGYRILAVRPDGRPVFGEPSFATVTTAAESAGPIDVVNIFRRSEAVPDLLPELLAVRPRLVWMQVGVRHEDTARALEAAGIPVVMDRCLMVEHPWLTSV